MEEKEQKVHEVEVLKEGEASMPDEKGIILARHLYPRQLPIIPLHQHPVFPKMTVPMIIGAESLKKMLSDIVKSKSKFVGLLLKKNNNLSTFYGPAKT